MHPVTVRRAPGRLASTAGRKPDPVRAELSPALGGRATLGSAGGATGGARSRAHDGVGLVWHPAAPGAWACDVERRGAGSFLARRFGLSEEEFLRRWVCTEVCAKLSDVPVLEWIRRRDLVRAAEAGVPFPAAGGSIEVELRTELRPYVLAFGRRTAAGADPRATKGAIPR